MDSYRILSAFIAGALLCPAVLLALLRVPMAPAWHAFRKAKRLTALACIVMSVAYALSALMGWATGTPVLFTWFVVANLQALLFTFTCVVFVSPLTRMRRQALRNAIPIAILTALMAGASLTSSPQPSPLTPLVEEQQKAEQTMSAADSLDHIREAVDRWVAAKLFLKPDVSVAEISRQKLAGGVQKFGSERLKTDYQCVAV